MSKEQHGSIYPSQKQIRFVITVGILFGVGLLGFGAFSVYKKVRLDNDRTHAETYMHMIGFGLNTATAPNNGVLPFPTNAEHQAVIQAGLYLGFDAHINPDFDALLLGQHVHVAGLISHFGPVGDGQGDHWLRFGTRIDHMRPGVLLGYDRASYAFDTEVIVLYEDLTVASVSHMEFQKLVQALGPGVDVMLPTRK